MNDQKHVAQLDATNREIMDAMFGEGAWDRAQARLASEPAGETDGDRAVREAEELRDLRVRHASPAELISYASRPRRTMTDAQLIRSMDRRRDARARILAPIRALLKGRSHGPPPRPIHAHTRAPRRAPTREGSGDGGSDDGGDGSDDYAAIKARADAEGSR
jgi:hypothetical protein